MSREFSVIGRRLPRPDAFDKATGAAKYTVDITLPGMLTAKVLRSPYPHAKIKRIDKSKAEILPGVEAVITLKDITNKEFNMAEAEVVTAPYMQGPKDQFVLTDKARYVGDAVAAVAAANEIVAEEALKLIEVEYEPLPSVFEVQEATKKDPPNIHRFVDGNVAIRFTSPLTTGDVNRGFKEADYVVEETFRTSRQKHCQLEPSSCVASFDPAGRLTVWSPHQGAYLARTQIADIFNHPVGKIKWVTPYVGGAFGGGASLRAEPVCIALARKTGKPVKLEYSREEEFVNTETRQPFIQTVKIGVKKEGTLTALKVRSIANAGAYFSHSGGTTGVNLSMALSLYKCPNLAGEAEIVYTNTPVSGGFRGYGNTETSFVLEQLIDIAAEKVGMDPLEFRLRNIKTAGEFALGHLIESTGLEECIKRGAEKIRWQEKRSRKKEGVRRRGVGMAVMMHVSGAFPFLLEESNALLKINEDGSADLIVSAADLGQGVHGALAQIAAEELGVPLEDINVISGDTDITLYDIGQHASRSVYVIGNAVCCAAKEAKRQLYDRAAKMLEASPEDLEINVGKIHVSGVPEKSIPVSEVARNSVYGFNQECAQISGKGSFQQSFFSPPFQAAFAEVEVDIEVGRVEVLRIVVAHDIGQAINPLTVEGQLEGGVLQGIGYALVEDFIINTDTAKVESDNFTTYKILSSLDLPEIETILVEKPDPRGPFGAKSVGESGQVAIAPAIANAIYDAIGVRITELPITPERILKALKMTGQCRFAAYKD